MSRTALITGATSGFGAAAARMLVDRGWRVIGIGRRADRLDALAAELGAHFHASACDVRDEVQREAMLAGLPASHRDIDLLVNNAGAALGVEPMQRSSLGDAFAMVDININALVALTHRLLPMLIERRGAIINISSAAASYPSATVAVYSGTKAFVSQFSLALRADLAGTGVRVTAIEPGMAKTEFRAVRSGKPEEAERSFDGTTPMTDDDVAATIAWIAELPPHLNVNMIEIMPTGQSFAGFTVDRRP